MCLYPKLILNKRYLPSKKNKGIVPICKDERLRYVAVGCGVCYECRKQKANQWKVRLYEELKTNSNAVFVTLTFDEEHLNKYSSITDENELATKAVRHFLERVRKKTKKSLKHFLITEKGHEGTERIHLHGIIWGDNVKEICEEKWLNGYIYFGEYVNNQTINYIIKYILKPDNDHDDFQGKILCTAGLGKNYIYSLNAKINKYNGEKTIETYRLNNGAKINLPNYYKNKIYSEEEKEKLWLQKIEKNEIYVMGHKVEATNEKGYFQLLNDKRAITEKVYNFKPQNWKKAKYLKKLKLLNEHIKNNIDIKKLNKLKKEGKNDLDFVNYKYVPEREDIPF